MTKAALLRKVLTENPNISQEEFFARTKVKVAASQFYDIRKGLRDAQVTVSAKRVKAVSKKKGIIARSGTRIQNLEKQIEFLQWQLQGEKNGFVKQLLVSAK